MLIQVAIIQQVRSFVEQFMQLYYRTIKSLSCLNDLLLQLFDEAILRPPQAASPKALNALCADLVRELGQALDAFEADPAIGCMVLTGSDKAFAAGADIKEMQAKTYMDAYLGDFIASWERVSRTRKDRKSVV